jgi:hypothetical protein
VSDADYFHETVASTRASGGVVPSFAPRTLRDAMPNRVFSIAGPSGSLRFNDVAVIGEVVSAENGPAYRHVGDDQREPVAFDDPRADEHAFDVKVQVEELYGIEGNMSPFLTFRMGAMGAKDLERFRQSLGELGRVVVLLWGCDDRDGRVLIPGEQGALIGQIDASGGLRFPGLGGEENRCVDEINTLAAFRAAAAEPMSRTVWDTQD